MSKICPSCGKACQDQAAFCPYCGSALGSAPQAPASNYQQSYDPSQSGYQQPGYSAGSFQGQSSSSLPPMPMKWFKFVIYFQLFAFAVINLWNALVAFADPGLPLLARDYPAIGILYTVYEVALVALAVYAVIVRSRLAKFKKNGPRSYLSLQGMSIACSVLYTTLLTILVKHFITDFNVITSLFSSILMLILNKKYFDKRAYLFVQ